MIMGKNVLRIPRDKPLMITVAGTAAGGFRKIAGWLIGITGCVFRIKPDQNSGNEAADNGCEYADILCAKHVLNDKEADDSNQNGTDVNALAQCGKEEIFVKRFLLYVQRKYQ